MDAWRDMVHIFFPAAVSMLVYISRTAFLWHTDSVQSPRCKLATIHSASTAFSSPLLATATIPTGVITQAGKISSGDCRAAQRRKESPLASVLAVLVRPKSTAVTPSEA